MDVVVDEKRGVVLDMTFSYITLALSPTLSALENKKEQRYRYSKAYPEQDINM